MLHKYYALSAVFRWCNFLCRGKRCPLWNAWIVGGKVHCVHVFFINFFLWAVPLNRRVIVQLRAGFFTQASSPALKKKRKTAWWDTSMVVQATDSQSMQAENFEASEKRPVAREKCVQSLRRFWTLIWKALVKAAFPIEKSMRTESILRWYRPKPI